MRECRQCVCVKARKHNKLVWDAGEVSEDENGDGFVECAFSGSPCG